MNTQDQSKARKLVIAAATSSAIGLAALGGAYTQATQAAESSPPGKAGAQQHDGAFGHMRGQMPHHRFGGGGPDGFGQHIEGRLAFLRTELHITESQSKVWEQFADTLRSMSKDAADKAKELRPRRESQSPENRMNERAERRSQSLMQRFEHSEARLQSMLERQRKLKAAVEPLYAALSEDQKKIADKLLRFGGDRRG